MKSDTYHHGNLKEELVEKGLAYIDQYGLEALSMRKLADSELPSCIKGRRRYMFRMQKSLFKAQRRAYTLFSPAYF